MPYVGRTPTPSPIDSSDIPDNSIDASKIIDGSIELAEIADNSITDAKLNSTKLDNIEYLSNSLLVASGTIDRQDDSNVFETVVGNTYKMANTDRFKNLDGNVLDTYGPELVTNGDFSDGTINNILLGTIGTTKVYVEGGSVNLTGSAWHKIELGTTIVGKTYLVKMHKKAVISVPNTLLTIGEGVASYPTVKNVNALSLSSTFGEDVELTFKATSTVTSVYIYVNSSGIVNFDNISVKEITTVDLTADMPEVQVQDQATNGLVVQSAVSAGDYVVIDKENLITGDNSTFDTSSGNWTDSYATARGVASWDSATNRLKLVDNGTQGHGVDPRITVTGLIVGKEYVFSFDLETSNTSGAVYSPNFGDTVLNDGLGTGRHNLVYTAGSTSATIYIYAYAGGTNYYDNISLQLKEDIYRATEDIPTLTSLTDARFETRDYVSNQIATTTLSDGTINSEVFFTDMTETDTVHDAWTANGWSKLSNGLYSKGLLVGTPMGVWQTLNKGAYLPWFNAMGCAAVRNNYNDGWKPWYDTDAVAPASNIAECFTAYSNGGVLQDTATTGLGGVNNNSGRPDSKFYDIIYKDQWIDCRIEANECNPVEELSAIGTKAKSGNVDGVSGLVGTEQYTAVVLDAYTSYINLGEDIDNISFINSIPVSAVSFATSVWNNSFHNFDNAGIQIKPFRYTNPNYVYFDSSQVAGGAKIGIVKTLPVLSSNTHLTTDVIGDPANYPQDMKDILASGKPLVGLNPLLVNQDGTSAIPDGVNRQFILTGKCLSSSTPALYTSDSGVNWGTNTRTIGLDNELGWYNLEDYRVVLAEYTAKNTTTKVSDPKAVKTVGNYATATNSHSIYKGNQLVPTGKVNVGNGSNGLESRGLENVGIDTEAYTHTTLDGYVYTYTGDTVKVVRGGASTFYGRSFEFVAGNGGKVYNTMTDEHLLQDWVWKEITDTIRTTPTHSTLTLDNAVSPAVKLLETIAVDADGMAHYQVFSEEMEWDYSGTVDTTAFGTLTLAAGTPILVPKDATNTPLAGRILISSAAKSAWTYWTNAALDDVTILPDGTLVYMTTGAAYGSFKLWDGNGFGSDGKFNQLTNGTRTDDNGNTVKTIVSSIPLNKYLGGN